jgi:hypothetical protein
MITKMPSTKDIDLKNDPLKILMVGENGTGKSLALASFYKAGTIRIADFDGRLKPIKTRFPEADINYDTFGADNFRQFLDEIEKLQDSCPWKTWALDSITSSSACSIVFQLVMKDKMKTTKGGLPATSWDEVNGETVLFTKMLEVMKIVHRKYKTNIIWTAHPIPKTEIGNDGTVNRTTSIASYGNKVPAIVPGYFDEIYNFQKEKVGMDSYKYTVYTVPKNNLPGKTAFPDKLPNSFDITGKNFYETLLSFLSK